MRTSAGVSKLGRALCALASAQTIQLEGYPVMEAQQVLTAGQTGLQLLLMITAPIVLVVLVVGLVVSIFQAVTQINEATLSFIPKLVAAIIALTLAARPQMVLAAVFGLVLFWPFLRDARGNAQARRACLGAFRAALTPFLVVAAAVMVYNFARFGSPLDFGAKFLAHRRSRLGCFGREG